MEAIISIPEEVSAQFYNYDLETISQKLISICIIGVTGHGKSSTANSIIGKSYFKVSSSAKSETSKVSAMIEKWYGRDHEDHMLVIDTPGLGDSEGRDTKHIANMVMSMNLIGFVHCFLIVINSEEPRFNK